MIVRVLAAISKGSDLFLFHGKRPRVSIRKTKHERVLDRVLAAISNGSGLLFWQRFVAHAHVHAAVARDAF